MSKKTSRFVKRQIIVRFLKSKEAGQGMGRSTLTLTEDEYRSNGDLQMKLRDWCLGLNGVEFGKATKTVTVNVLVTGFEGSTSIIERLIKEGT